MRQIDQPSGGDETKLDPRMRAGEPRGQCGIPLLAVHPVHMHPQQPGHRRVTAGLLVQRFGSKRGLMVRLAELSAGASAGFIEGLRERYDSPLAVLEAVMSTAERGLTSYTALTAALAPAARE